MEPKEPKQEKFNPLAKGLLIYSYETGCHIVGTWAFRTSEEGRRFKNLVEAYIRSIQDTGER